jgi:hypothetical protein
MRNARLIVELQKTGVKLGLQGIPFDLVHSYPGPSTFLAWASPHKKPFVAYEQCTFCCIVTGHGV